MKRRNHSAVAVKTGGIAFNHNVVAVKAGGKGYNHGCTS